MPYLKLAALAALLALPCAANAASFDCGKAATAVEKLICGSAELSELDEYLGRYYGAARAALGLAAPCMVKDQRDWLRKSRNACKDAACLRRVYLARLAELDPLQPGASAVKNIELPKVKTLVWIVPPAEDAVAAPPPVKWVPLVHPGKLLNEMAGGDGYVLIDDAGTRQALVQLMFIDNPTGARLEALARDKGARLEARGILEQAPGGKPHFSPGACVAIYRLP